MPRGKGSQRGGQKKFHRKNYKHPPVKKRFKFGSAATSDANKKSTSIEQEKFKKFKHIQRSKESEQLHRKQKEFEISLQQKNAEPEEEDSFSSDEDIDPMDQLLTSLQARAPQRKGIKRKAIESSESSSEDDDNNAESEEEHADLNDDEDEDYLDENDEEKDEGLAENKEENEDLAKNKDEDLAKNEYKSEQEAESNTKETEDKSEDDNGDTEEEFDEEIEQISTTKSKDMFAEHLDNLLSSNLLESISKSLKSETHRLDWPILNRLQVNIPIAESNEKQKPRILDDDQMYAAEGTIPQRIDSKTIDLNKLAIKNQIQTNLMTANKKHLEKTENTSSILTPLQCEIFSIVNNYQDLYYPHRTLQNGNEIRMIYCLHTINHILKTRAKILHHNAKLSKAAAESKSSESIPDAYRDHGLFRPKAIIIVPFKNAAFHIINTIIELIFPQLGGTVMNHKKFLDEFTGDSLYFPKRNPKPEDYELTFAGNTDDMFRIGLCLTRKCLKLYSSFYASDIIIASPLGLRTIIGAAGEKDRDYDFLASIELLIIDQADVILAQNWDHLLHVLEHLHLQPKSARDTDFSRVRTWCLNGWSRFYRQSMLFATHDMPEFRSLFNSKCSNYRGKIRTINPITVGSIQHVAVPIPQAFHRIAVSSIQSSFDQRFNHFVNVILPQFKGPLMAHCLIYIPSYFDYVRIRNYFKKESLSFVQICEYTKDAKIARSRDMFFHSSAHFLLYSERAHYFRRTRIKDIRHLIMYQPPAWPHFYSEMVNLMQEANQNPRDGSGGDNSMSVTVLYTKYDMLQVAAIVGSDRADKMASSEKTSHMYMTGD